MVKVKHIIGSFSNVTTDMYGDAEFNVAFPGSILNGKYYTATATDPDGNTSEFSAWKTPEFKTKSFGNHYVVNTTESGIPLHWKDGNAKYKTSTSIPSEFVTAVVEGFNTWSNTSSLNGLLNYTADGTTTSVQWGGDPDGINNTAWLTDWSVTETNDQVVAVTRVRYNALNGELTDCDIAFNAKFISVVNHRRHFCFRCSKRSNT